MKKKKKAKILLRKKLWLKRKKLDYNFYEFKFIIKFNKNIINSTIYTLKKCSK